MHARACALMYMRKQHDIVHKLHGIVCVHTPCAHPKLVDLAHAIVLHVHKHTQKTQYCKHVRAYKHIAHTHLMLDC